MRVQDIKPGKYVVSGFRGYFVVTRVDIVRGLVECKRGDLTVHGGRPLTKIFKADQIIKKYEESKP